MKLTEVKPMIDKLATDALSLQGFVDTDAEQAVRLALEAAFVAGVRSGQVHEQREVCRSVRRKEERQVKFLETTKDGGAESTVWAHWLIELKGLFSVALLRFEDGTRDAYHSHAFDCVSWVLSGELLEEHAPSAADLWFDNRVDVHTPSLLPVVTRRSTYHRVRSVGRTWVLTFRGPWSKTWREAVPDGKGGYAERTLTHGRKEVHA